MFLSFDGGRSWIYSPGTTQGARHQRFLALMLDTPGSIALAPPRRGALTFLSVDGERSRINNFVTSQGACRRHFLR
jgi:hypothetical protein